MSQSHSSIFNSSKRGELRRFLRFICITVLLPSCLAIAAIEWAGWRTGATMTPDAIGYAQHENPNLIYIGDLPEYASVRLSRIRIEQPDVVFLGTSRCTEFRSRMLRPYKAYNMCASAGSIAQVTQLIERTMEVARPKIIVFTIDYFMFTDNWSLDVTQRMTMNKGYNLRTNFNGIIRLSEHFKARPLEILRYLVHRKTEPVDGMTLLGLDAIRDDTGFRFDGSVLYPPFYTEMAPAHNGSVTFGILANIQGGPRMEENQIEELRRLTVTAKRLGVKVVAMAMPIVGSTVNYLDNEPSYQHYAGIWREFQSDTTRRLFQEMDLPLIDLTRDPVKDDPRNFVDSGHPAESAFLGAFVHHLDDPVFRSVFPLIDAEGLRHDYELAKQNNAFFNIYRGAF
jgi:hypothetical protein